MAAACRNWRPLQAARQGMVIEAIARAVAALDSTVGPLAVRLLQQPGRSRDLSLTDLMEERNGTGARSRDGPEAGCVRTASAARAGTT